MRKETKEGIFEKKDLGIFQILENGTIAVREVALYDLLLWLADQERQQKNVAKSFVLK